MPELSSPSSPATTANAPLFVIDWALVAALLRRRRRRYAMIATVLMLFSMAGMLLFFPRKYLSVAGLSIQQGVSTNLFSSALSTITKGKTGASTSYSGVIKSRRFAEAALKATNLSALYRFEDEDDAVEFMQESVNFIDRYDGLVYIEVGLAGPSRFIEKGRADQIRQAARVAAKSYVDSLQQYLATTNSDRDASLLRQAEKLTRQARNDYQTALQTLNRFLKQKRPVAVEGQALSMAASARDSVSLSELQNLYQARTELQTQLRAAEEARKQVARLARSSESLPGEDPLLADARRQLRDAETELQNLRITLAETNPDVVSAKERVRLAEQRLRREQNAVLANRTSNSVDQSALAARYAVIQQQIAVAENTFRASRNLATDLEILRNDVLLKFEILKAAETNNAELHIQTVAGDSRMDIVDPPRIPKRGRPGGALLAVSGIVLGLFLLLLLFVVDYVRAVRHGSKQPSAPSGNPDNASGNPENGHGQALPRTRESRSIEEQRP